MADISCGKFTDYLIRKSEHLDDELLRDVTPASSIIGMVETGRFKAEDGVSHTFDKMNRVFPDLSAPWVDVAGGYGAASCNGTPCDPTEKKIGMGFTRSTYKLQQASYGTDLFCYDLIMSADRAKQQFAHTIEVLRDATDIINSNRLRNELMRNAGKLWACTLTGLTAITFTETGDLINVTPSALPTSKLVTNMLRSRLAYQLLSGATGKVVKGDPAELEVLTDRDTIWDAVQGDSNLADHWRFEDFAVGAKEYYRYGWSARVGNFMLHSDLHPIRFNVNGSILSRVFPYTNIAATAGIKGDVNQAYIDAPVQLSLLHHRRAIRSLMRDTISVNPMMPFAARDFGGKWQFVMDNLTCGTAQATNAAGAAITIPIAVDNSRRNKGKFIADFSYATQAQFPEYEEGFLHLREQPNIIGVAPCATTPSYVTQQFASSNDVCA